MIIQLKDIEKTIIPNFRGGEKEMHAHIFADARNKIILGKLEPGASIGLHTHETSSEIIFILQGKGKTICDGAYEDVSSGLCHYCPKGSRHSLINDGDSDLIFYAVVPEQ